MNARAIPVLPLGMLVLLAALTFWLSRYIQPDSARAESKMRHEPDLIVENFAAQMLGAQGDVEYAVNAGRMTHYLDDDSSLLENVVLTANQANHPKVTAMAPRGQLFRHREGSDEVVLDGGVSLESEPDDRYPPLRLTTPRLTVLPDKHSAHSADGVVLRSPTGELTAKSFVLNTLTRRIVFSAVHLKYASRSKP